MVPNMPRQATLKLNLTTEIEWLIPNLILRSGLILHAAAALHCKTTGIISRCVALLVNRVHGRVRSAVTISTV